MFPPALTDRFFALFDRIARHFPSKTLLETGSNAVKPHLFPVTFATISHHILRQHANPRAKCLGFGRLDARQNT